jgi:exocyst complex component 4
VIVNLPLQASIYLLALNNSLCAMLNTSPFHRENYSRLILAVVIQFYQKCSDRFHALTAYPDSGITQEPRIALAAQWAQRTEFQTSLSELLNTDVSYFSTI